MELYLHICRKALHVYLHRSACRIDKFVHAAWRQVKVVYIPKPGKNNYTETKAFRLISLSSFLPRTLENLRDNILIKAPRNKVQFAH
jgi:hypothetical protein